MSTRLSIKETIILGNAIVFTLLGAISFTLISIPFYEAHPIAIAGFIAVCCVTYVLCYRYFFVGGNAPRLLSAVVGCFIAASIIIAFS